jgi:hypothetical protein
MQWYLNTCLGYHIWQEVSSPCAGLIEKVEHNDLQGMVATVVHYGVMLLTIDIQEDF